MATKNKTNVLYMAKKKVLLVSILKKDREVFYKFMCWHSLIEKSDTNKSLNKKYPPTFTSDITSIFGKSELVTFKSHAELLRHKQPNTSIHFFYVSDKSRCIDLLRHIRNSIAHDLISYDKKKKVFNIVDYNMYEKLTAEGVIEAEKMYNLLKIVLKASDLRNK